MQTISTPVFQNKAKPQRKKEVPPDLHLGFAEALDLFWGSALVPFPKRHWNGVYCGFTELPKVSCTASEIPDAGY